jgi:hypothetical protein
MPEILKVLRGNKEALSQILPANKSVTISTTTVKDLNTDEFVTTGEVHTTSRLKDISVNTPEKESIILKETKAASAALANEIHQNWPMLLGLLVTGGVLGTKGNYIIFTELKGFCYNNQEQIKAKMQQIRKERDVAACVLKYTNPFVITKDPLCIFLVDKVQITEYTLQMKQRNNNLRSC